MSGHVPDYGKRHLADFINGLQLFASKGSHSFNAQHDTVYAGGSGRGPEPEPLTDGDRADLEAWGWWESEEYECWGFFT